MSACAPVSAAQAPVIASSADTARITADKTAVAQLEQRWLTDIAHGESRDLATILADDYQDIDWQGHTRSKTELLAGLHTPPTSTQHVTHLSIRVWGEAAVATGVNQVHSTSQGWTVEVPFTDVFARIDGHWRAVSSQETLRKPVTQQHDRND